MARGTPRDDEFLRLIKSRRFVSPKRPSAGGQTASCPTGAAFPQTSQGFTPILDATIIKEYLNQEQVKLRFQFTGLVDPTDGTVVTPQATVDYGFNWFSISDGSGSSALAKQPGKTFPGFHGNFFLASVVSYIRDASR